MAIASVRQRRLHAEEQRRRAHLSGGDALDDLAFANFYGSQHAGRDAKDNLGPGMIPTKEAARGLAFGGWYGQAHAGRDAKDNLGPGMIPTKEAARGLAFGGWYGQAHAGRDAKDNLGPGMVPTKEAARGLAFEGWYGSAHDGFDTRESRRPQPPPSAPPPIAGAGRAQPQQPVADERQQQSGVRTGEQGPRGGGASHTERERQMAAELAAVRAENEGLRSVNEYLVRELRIYASLWEEETARINGAPGR